ncbi:MAG: efflux RND transporter permease subunit [Flavobacteriales bacterium]|nr:efflux RND transporter permease subunit [Flavobacteriales bacterium]
MKKRNFSFTIIILTVALVLVGVAFLPRLPIKLNPGRTLPVITVSFSMKDASSRVVESEITSRMEAMLSRIDGITRIESVSRKGGGNVTLTFDKETDMDVARFDVSSAVRQFWPSMPDGAMYPSVMMRGTQATDDAPRTFLSYTVNAPEAPHKIQQYIETTIKPRIAQIDGVAEVDITGATSMYWHLEYDARKLRDMGIKIQDVRDAISLYTSREAIGMGHEIRDDGTVNYIRISIAPVSTFDIEEIKNIPVKLVDGTMITLDKLVKVSYQQAEPTSYFRINGLNTLSITILSESTANQLALGKKVRGQMDSFMKSLPYGYQMRLSSDATVYIQEELNKIYLRSGLTIFILLLFVLAVSASVRYTFMIVATMIANLAVAVIFYYLLGVELHLMSLAGLTISLGLIMDNAIVIADHIKHRGDMRAFLAVLAATLTTISSVVVILFLPEEERILLEDFAVVIIVNLAVSLVTALFLVPALMDKLHIRDRNRHSTFHHGGYCPVWWKKFPLRGKRSVVFFNRVYASQMRFMYRWRWVFIILAVLAFGLPVFKLPESIKDDSVWYAELYNNTLGSRKYREKIKPVADKVLGGSLRLFSEKVSKGFNFSSSADDEGETVITINGSMPSGTTLENMNAVTMKMEAFLSTFPQIRQFQTRVYTGSTSISVYFTREAERTSFPLQLYNDITTVASEIGGAQWTARCQGEYFSNRTSESAGSSAVAFYGYNYDKLYEIANDFRCRLEENKRVSDVSINSSRTYSKNDYTEYSFDFNTQEMVRQGISPMMVSSNINNYMSTSNIHAITNDDGTRENVIMAPREREEYDIWDVRHNAEYIDTVSQYKLNNVAHVVKTQAPSDIRKVNQQYTLVLQYSYIGSSDSNRAMLKKFIEEYSETLPVGYTIKNMQGGWTWADEDSNQYAVLALVIVIIFFLCSILFNSLLQPLAVIMVIPISLIGLFLTYYLFEIKVDGGTFASMLLLCGITVNASIYILNDYNNLIKKSRLSPILTYRKAFNAKITSILLTVLSTILGFVPFLIGERERIWFTLAVGTIGGLVMSIIGIYFFLPIFMGIGAKKSMSS